MIGRHIDVDDFAAHWTIRHVGAVFGLVGGFLAGIGGLILCAATYFAAASISEITLINDANAVGTCLTISTIPLLMAGAYCLDKLDESVKQKELVLKKKKRVRFEGAEFYQKQ